MVKLLILALLLIALAVPALAWMGGGPGQPTVAPTCAGGTLDFSQACNSSLLMVIL